MGWLHLIRARRKHNSKLREATKHMFPEHASPEAGATKGSTYNIDFAEAGSPSVIVGADSVDSIEQPSLLQNLMDTEDDELKRPTRFVGGLSSSKNISI